MDLTEAMEFFEKIRKRFQKHQSDFSEFRTRILLIDPVLRLLGWDVENPDFVVLEYQPSTRKRQSADYILKNDEKNVAIVEAKNIDKKIDDLEYREQADNYARYAGARFFILTNGVRWLLYERTLTTGFESLKPIVHFDIVHDKSYQCALAALSIWRPNLASEEPVFISDGSSERQPPDKPPKGGGVPDEEEEKPDEKGDEGKKPPTRLIVTMPNGEKIDRDAAIDTFVEVIEKLGIDRVRDVFPELNMGGQTNTKTKKRILEEVARRLGVQLKVEIVPKN